MGNPPLLDLSHLLWKLIPQVSIHAYLQLVIDFIYHIQYTSFTIYIFNPWIKMRDVTTHQILIWLETSTTSLVSKANRASSEIEFQALQS
jgi:hypothetical protein